MTVEEIIHHDLYTAQYRRVCGWSVEMLLSVLLKVDHVDDTAEAENLEAMIADICKRHADKETAATVSRLVQYLNVEDIEGNPRDKAIAGPAVRPGGVRYG